MRKNLGVIWIGIAMNTSANLEDHLYLIWFLFWSILWWSYSNHFQRCVFFLRVELVYCDFFVSLAVSHNFWYIIISLSLILYYSLIINFFTFFLFVMIIRHCEIDVSFFNSFKVLHQLSNIYSLSLWVPQSQKVSSFNPLPQALA